MEIFRKRLVDARCEKAKNGAADQLHASVSRPQQTRAAPAGRQWYFADRAKLELTMAEKQKPFRVMCTSADQPRPHFEYFSTKEEAERWAHSAIRAGMFGQVSVEEMYEGGDWKLVAAHTTLAELRL